MAITCVNILTISLSQNGYEHGNDRGDAGDGDGECGGDDSDDGDGDEYDYDDDEDLFMRRRRLSLYMVHASVPSRAVLGTNGRA